MEIIPAIDIRDGRCVRLQQGDFARETVFAEDPAAMAAHWRRLGAPRLHVVDLDGAAGGSVQNEDVVRRVVEAAAPVPVQLGGGIRDLTTVAAVLASGVDRVVLGTAAVTDPDFVAAAVLRHPGQVVVALDARGGKLAIKGWLEDTDLSAVMVARRMEALGVPRFLYTDIMRDGTETGPHYEALAEIVAATSSPVLASGGVANTGHLARLRELRVEGVIVGRALYTGALDLSEALAMTGS